MKKIEAYIKPHKLPDVTMALQSVAGLGGMSVISARGFGRREGTGAPGLKVDDLMDFSGHAKIEIFCSDDLVDMIVSVLDRTASTGLRGDGKIYVSDVIGAHKIGKGTINDQGQKVE